MLGSDLQDAMIQLFLKVPEVAMHVKPEDDGQLSVNPSGVKMIEDARLPICL